MRWEGDARRARRDGGGDAARRRARARARVAWVMERRPSSSVVASGVGDGVEVGERGFEVTLLEKNEDVGGRCRSEEFAGGGEGYRFDTGPSLMLLPERYMEQFTSVGEKMEDYLDVERVDPAYRALW